MELIEIKQDGWDPETLWVELTIGNICNFKCWYCFPGYNDGSIKWPDYDLLISNLSHLLDYYQTHTDKKKFAIHLLGGEIIFWKRFVDLSKFLKENYNCVIILTTNASKNIDWWEESVGWLDIVHISVHHEFSNPKHIIDVADFLYDKKVEVEVNVFMDPFKWETCADIVEALKNSKNVWDINYKEIQFDIHRRYNKDQDELLNKVNARSSNKDKKFVIAPMSHRHFVKGVDVNGKEQSYGFNDLLSQRNNEFKGWDCNVGVDWIAVHADGTVSGICRNGLYKDGKTYNIFDLNFKEQFNPSITSSICTTDRCWCIFEVNMPKRKIIPILS